MHNRLRSRVTLIHGVPLQVLQHEVNPSGKRGVKNYYAGIIFPQGLGPEAKTQGGILETLA